MNRNNTDFGRAASVRAMKAGEKAFKSVRKVSSAAAWMTASDPLRARFQPVNSGSQLPGLWRLHSISSGNIKPLDSRQWREGSCSLVQQNLNQNQTQSDDPLVELVEGHLNLVCLLLRLNKDKNKADAYMTRPVKHPHVYIIIIVFRTFCRRIGSGCNDTGLSRYSEEQQSSAFIKLLSCIQPTAGMESIFIIFRGKPSPFQNTVRLRNTKLACYIIPIGGLQHWLPV